MGVRSEEGGMSRGESLLVALSALAVSLAVAHEPSAVGADGRQGGPLAAQAVRARELGKSTQHLSVQVERPLDEGFSSIKAHTCDGFRGDA